MTDTPPEARARRPVPALVAMVVVVTVHVIGVPVVVLGGILLGVISEMVTANCGPLTEDLPQCDGSLVGRARMLLAAMVLAGPVAGTVALVFALRGRTAGWHGLAGAWAVSLLFLLATLNVGI